MRFILLMVTTLLLTACATKETEYVVKTEYKYVTYQLPKSLTTNCIATKPISPTEFTKMNQEERETYLANYAIKLLGDVKKCDNKLKSVVKYIDEINKTSRMDEVSLKEKR